MIQYRRVTDSQPPSRPRCRNKYALCISASRSKKLICRQIYKPFTEPDYGDLRLRRAHTLTHAHTHSHRVTYDQCRRPVFATDYTDGAAHYDPTQPAARFVSGARCNSFVSVFMQHLLLLALTTLLYMSRPQWRFQLLLKFDGPNVVEED